MKAANTRTYQVLRPTKHDLTFISVRRQPSAWIFKRFDVAVQGHHVTENILCTGKNLSLSSLLGSQGIHGHQTLAFYVSTHSSVGPEIEVALGLSSLHYDSCLYFPLHMYGILQRALLDVRMQPAGIN